MERLGPAKHPMGYTGVCILVILGDEGDFHVMCHLWNNLLFQLAQSLYASYLLESDKEGRIHFSSVSGTLHKPGKKQAAVGFAITTKMKHGRALELIRGGVSRK